MTETAVENRITDSDHDFSVHPFTRTRDKVAIVGFTQHRDTALELDDSYEIWGLNELHRYMPKERFHRWFEIHPREDLEQDQDGNQHLEELGTLRIPVYMHHHHEDIPASLPFPRNELVDALGIDYFTCCPAWMIGMAIAMDFEEIQVIGVDMATDTEYADQRPCCEFWIGVARGMGKTVIVPDVSDLLKSVGQYGFGKEGGMFVAKLDERIAWLHERDNDLLKALRKLDGEYQTKHQNHLAIYHRTQGAVGEQTLQPKIPQRLERIGGLESELVELEGQLNSLDAQYKEVHEKLSAERNQIVGAIQDCTFWRRSWGIHSHSPNSTTAMPDRSLDLRTGISDNGEQPGEQEP